MKKLLLAAALAVFSFPALAAVISPTYYGATGIDTFQWNQVNNDDTTAEVLLKEPGLWNLFIDGTTTGLDMKLQYGKTSGSLKDVDTDNMPDGVRFSSVTTNSTNVCLPAGYVDISFTSTGTGQDVDIWMNRIGDCQ